MKDKDMSFEKALADLDQVVEKLEKGGLSLNESLGLFEKGVKLARFLRGELEKAEKKVEILLKDEKGGTRREAFSLEEGEEASSAEEGEPAEEENDDGGAARADKKSRPRNPKKEDGGTLPF
jgi:exodeoxyribonuclease VII small subunit